MNSIEYSSNTDELANNWLDEIYNFLEDYSGVYPTSPTNDIFKELGITGDDFHEMIDDFSIRYEVDMADYLWYFHSNEEGGPGIGSFFFKPPYERVERVPVTPIMLASFIVSKKWTINYPEHSLPKYRIDLWISTFIFIFAVVLAIVLWLF